MKKCAFLILPCLLMSLTGCDLSKLLDFSANEDSYEADDSSYDDDDDYSEEESSSSIKEDIPYAEYVRNSMNAARESTGYYLDCHAYSIEQDGDRSDHYNIIAALDKTFYFKYYTIYDDDPEIYDYIERYNELKPTEDWETRRGSEESSWFRIIDDDGLDMETRIALNMCEGAYNDIGALYQPYANFGGAISTSTIYLNRECTKITYESPSTSYLHYDIEIIYDVQTYICLYFMMTIDDNYGTTTTFFEVNELRFAWSPNIPDPEWTW